MKKIIEFISNNGYVIDDNGSFFIDGHNEFLRISICKEADDQYMVRNAILCHFDRWANSGIEFRVKSETEVIDYFSSVRCITDAVMELVECVVEDSFDNGDKSKIENMVDYLFALLDVNSEERCMP